MLYRSILGRLATITAHKMTIAAISIQQGGKPNRPSMNLTNMGNHYLMGAITDEHICLTEKDHLGIG